MLLINTRARRGRALAEAAPRLLASHGLVVRRVICVDQPSRLGEAMIEALALDPDLLVVGGGDGTVSSVVAHLAHRDVALGVLPLGTTNNLARSLGIPLGLGAATATLAYGKVADVDLGRAGDRLFANMVSIGVSVKVAGQVPHRLKRVLGRAAYPLTALRALPDHRPFRARITAQGTTQEFWTHQLNIANGGFHAGRLLARDAGIDDRLLVAYRLGTASRAHLIGSMLRHAVTGPRRRLADDAFLAVGELTVETDPVLALDVDGEVVDTTPVTISVVPNALRVVVPQDFIDT
ncbi:MAG: diacylglycerol kinase catalytic region [Actinomycetia bacterium]|nr:diacylglycerol kinase catalytic region [Actinomycetes bacterium]